MSSAVFAAVSMNPSMAWERMTSNEAMPVSLTARFNRASVPCAAAVTVTWYPASMSPSMPAAAFASSPRYSPGLPAASCTWFGRLASTPKLVRVHTSWLEYASELMVSS